VGAGGGQNSGSEKTAQDGIAVHITS
jgi:hypothetical protein